MGVEPLFNQGILRTGRRGRPRWKPAAVIADKAYSAAWLLDVLRCKGIVPIIPNRVDQPHNPDFNRKTYRQRNRVERLVGKLKQFCRVATRYVRAAARIEASQPLPHLRPDRLATGPSGSACCVGPEGTTAGVSANEVVLRHLPAARGATAGDLAADGMSNGRTVRHSCDRDPILMTSGDCLAHQIVRQSPEECRPSTGCGRHPGWPSIFGQQDHAGCYQCPCLIKSRRRCPVLELHHPIYGSRAAC